MSLPVLIPAALAASVISGAIGMGGGVFLLAVMAAVLSPSVVVPIHGAVQLASNFTRSARLLSRVSWRIVLLYVPTMVLGIGIGLQLYRGAGMPWFRPLIGVFVVAFLLWDRFHPRHLRLPRWTFAPAGLIGGVMTIVIGASGPYLAAFFLRDDLDREEIVATKAVIQTLGHLLKVPAFLSIGFDYPRELHLLIPLLACAVGGTFLGTWALHRMGERVFRIAFRVVLGGLALRLLLDPVL
jgi:uncharacterized membrane protein YfcA